MVTKDIWVQRTFLSFYPHTLFKMGLEVKSSYVIREKHFLLLEGKCTQLRASENVMVSSSSGCFLPADDLGEAVLSVALYYTFSKN